MVDVGRKDESHRTAVASATVKMKKTTSERIRNREFAKGDVAEVARIAGIMAVKQTPQLIPLCHTINVDSVDVVIEFESETELSIIGTVRAKDRTGVEMEALACVSVAALTVYDMCKSVDKEMVISETKLLKKTGGKSGDFVRS